MSMPAKSESADWTGIYGDIRGPYQLQKCVDLSAIMVYNPREETRTNHKEIGADN